MKFEAGVIFLISVIGATFTTTIYLNNTYATQSRLIELNGKVTKRTEIVDSKLSRIDKLICKMAIKQNVEDAENICTGE